MSSLTHGRHTFSIPLRKVPHESHGDESIYPVNNSVQPLEYRLNPQGVYSTANIPPSAAHSNLWSSSAAFNAKDSHTTLNILPSHIEKPETGSAFDDGLTPKLHQSTSSRHRLWKTWWLEVVCMVVGFGCFAGEYLIAPLLTQSRPLLTHNVYD
jgi:hypothetical protein